jgi:hypothetical protein
MSSKIWRPAGTPEGLKGQQNRDFLLITSRSTSNNEDEALAAVVAHLRGAAFYTIPFTEFSFSGRKLHQRHNPGTNCVSMPSEIRDKNWGTRTRFTALLRRQYGYDLRRRCSCVIHEGGLRQILAVGRICRLLRHAPPGGALL